MNQAGNGELDFCMDGGGSRRRGRFIDIEGRALAETTGGPFNPSRAPEERTLLFGETMEQV